MKKAVAIVLILAMSGQCLYKLGVMTYFELNRDYIAEVLCINKAKPITMCYGQCFLKKNLTLPDETEKVPAPVSKDKLDVPVFLISENKFAITLSPKIIFHTTSDTGITSAGFGSPAFRPPSVI